MKLNNASEPVLLVLYNHYSQMMNFSLIDLEKENHVTIVCLPPHLINKMQPLDVSVEDFLWTAWTGNRKLDN